VSPFWRILPVRLVVVGAIIVIVPLIALLLLITLMISVAVFNPAVCISIADDVAEVTIVPTIPSTTLLRWSDVAGQVSMGTMSVIILVTPVFVLLVMDWISYGYCV
jgi:hypothetical protein